MNYYCNPLNIDYLYQYNKNRKKEGKIEIAREAADPSMIEYKGKYYIFASMTLGVWVSENMAIWEYFKLPDTLPLYDYAPDARVMNGYVYVCASKAEGVCNFYRTKDVINGPYEEIKGTFTFWDPNLFEDDDGKCYFYWGCSNIDPICGVELDKDTMIPIGEKKVVITYNTYEKGFERKGDDHSIHPLSETEVELRYQQFLKEGSTNEEELSNETKKIIKSMLTQSPYIEGAWMNKYKGQYYLQYSSPGTQYSTYSDATYVSQNPLGPFVLANNNPYSYKPGGFITGAGHGSTMEDHQGNYWHASTMRISMNHQFERRLGLWPAGFDDDGELFCNQNYGDWPRKIEERIMNPWFDPEWYLLSYKKRIKASSFEKNNPPESAVDENIQTWWKASTDVAGEWLTLDLGSVYDVRAVQINFADDQIQRSIPGILHDAGMPRYIDDSELCTRWFLEGSIDGKDFFLIEDKSDVETNLPHDFFVIEKGINTRYLKLTILKIPYALKCCISGFRVFGMGAGKKPPISEYTLKKIGVTDMEITITDHNAIGHNILWGYETSKLYHSFLTYKDIEKIGALLKNQEVFVRIDSFNENGITKGKIQQLV